MFVVRLALFIASIVANIFTMIRNAFSYFIPFTTLTGVSKYFDRLCRPL